jgi:glycosyltransferase involved in cell wall biosynthesis
MQKNRKPSALLFSIYFPPDPGGASSAAWNRALILNRIGFSVIVVSAYPSYPTGKVSDPRYPDKENTIFLETRDNLKLIRLRHLPVRHSGIFRRFMIFSHFVFLTLFSIPKILRITGKIDLVYSFSPTIFASFSGYIYSKITKSLFVYEASDLWPEQLQVFRSRPNPLIMQIGKIAAKISYTLPDVLIVISQLAANHVSEKYRPKAPVYALPIGVDTQKFHKYPKVESRVDLFAKGLLPKEYLGKFIILYAGVITKATQAVDLAFAALKLKDDETNVAFLIIGEGEEKQKIQKLKDKYELDNVCLLPFQERDLMPTIISAADLCVVSISSEPIYSVVIPTKFYEYIACRKPLIGICHGDLQRLITSSKIGCTVSPSDIDSLALIIRDLNLSPTRLDEMEANIGNILESFSIDSLATNFLNKISPVLASKSGVKLN